MKKILVTIAVITSFWSSQAFAWGAREQGILSGVAGLWVYQQLSRPPVAVYQQPPVVYQQSPSVNYQKCTPWVESIDAYGVTTRTRTCY